VDRLANEYPQLSIDNKLSAFSGFSKPLNSGSFSMSDVWLNAKQAGDYLGFSDWSMRSFAKRKLVRHSRLPGGAGEYRFKREWLDEFMEARTVEPKRSMVIPPKPILKLSDTVSKLNPDLAAAMERVRARAAKGKVAK